MTLLELIYLVSVHNNQNAFIDELVLTVDELLDNWEKFDVSRYEQEFSYLRVNLDKSTLQQFKSWQTKGVIPKDKDIKDIIKLLEIIHDTVLVNGEESPKSSKDVGEISDTDLPF